MRRRDSVLGNGGSAGNSTRHWTRKMVLRQGQEDLLVCWIGWESIDMTLRNWKTGLPLTGKNWSWSRIGKQDHQSDCTRGLRWVGLIEHLWSPKHNSSVSQGQCYHHFLYETAVAQHVEVNCPESYSKEIAPQGLKQGFSIPSWRLFLGRHSWESNSPTKVDH